MLPERLEEASRIRHCALSLVGEPIMVSVVAAYLIPHGLNDRMRACMLRFVGLELRVLFFRLYWLYCYSLCSSMTVL